MMCATSTCVCVRLTWSWKVAVAHAAVCCLCNSTSSVWVYSASTELWPRKLTRCGSPNFLRSVSASKCTSRAGRAQRGGKGETERERETESNHFKDRNVRAHREHFAEASGDGT